jgi:hypothetical protein
VSTIISRRGRTQLLFLSLTALSVQLFFETNARADTKEDYKHFIGEAVHEYDAEHWQSAIELFQKAYNIRPNARALRGMGLAAYEDQRYAEAVKWLSQALDHPVLPLNASLRAEIKPVLERAREFVGYYKLHRNPENLTVEIDGQSTSVEDGKLAMNVGERVFVAIAKGFEPLKQTLTVKPGDNGILGIKLEPLHISTLKPTKRATTLKSSADSDRAAKGQSSTNKVIGWVLVGTGTAMAIGGGVLFGIAIKNKYDIESAKTWDKRDQSDLDNVPIFSGTGAALAGVGVVSLAVGLAMVATGGANAEKTTATAGESNAGLQVHLGLSGLSMSGGF